MMPIKAIETFRVVMPRNSLEKLARLESMGKKPLERQYLQKGRKKLRKNTQFRKSLALRKYIPQKYESPKIELIL
jgi:hypothetical protein